MKKMLKFILFFAGLGPLISLLFQYFIDQLGAEPIEVLIERTGLWSLRFLLFTLMITPLRIFTGWQELEELNVRRTLGLYAFFYSGLHVLSYLWFEQNFEWIEIFKDLATRPPMAIGWLSFILMFFLAFSSYEPVKQSLGQFRWKHLHQFIYLIAIGGIMHFWWLTKIDIREPILYSIILIILLLLRSLRNFGVNRYK